MAGTPIKFEIVKHIGVINRNIMEWSAAQIWYQRLGRAAWENEPWNHFDKTGDWARCRGVPEWIRIVSFASVWAARFDWEYKQTSL